MGSLAEASSCACRRAGGLQPLTLPWGIYPKLHSFPQAPPQCGVSPRRGARQGQGLADPIPKGQPQLGKGKSGWGDQAPLPTRCQPQPVPTPRGTGSNSQGLASARHDAVGPGRRTIVSEKLAERLGAPATSLTNPSPSPTTLGKPAQP